MPFSVIFEPNATSGYFISGIPIHTPKKSTSWVLGKIIADKLRLEQRTHRRIARTRMIEDKEM
jgi:hypothetical protein